MGMKIALLASRRCAVRAGLRILSTGGKGEGSEEDRAGEQRSPEDREDFIAEAWVVMTIV